MIDIISKKYTDVFGSEFDDYQANPFDYHKLTIVFRLKIFIKSSNTVSVTVRQFEGLPSILDITGISPIQAGFKVGDKILIDGRAKTNSSVAVVQKRVIRAISDSSIEVDDIDGGNFDSNEKDWYITLDPQEYPNNEPEPNVFHWIDVSFNQCDSETSSYQSLIDQTKTTFSGTLPAANNSTTLLSNSGKQSGQYVDQIQVKKTTISSGYHYFEAEITFLQSGGRTKAAFDESKQIKNVVNIEVSRTSSSSTGNQSGKLEDNANTGWFNQAYNVGFDDTKLVSVSTNRIAYNIPTEFSATVNMRNVRKVQMGFSWIPVKQENYKNKLEYHQGYWSCCSKMDDFIDLNVQFTGNKVFNKYSAPDTNTTKANASLTCVSLNSPAGTNDYIFNLKFEPNFDDSFILEGDRLFYIWIKAGNVTHLIFSGQLVKVIDESQPLTTTNFSIQDFTQNAFVTGNLIPEKVNTEDFLALCANVPMTVNTDYQGIRFRCYAQKNTDKFTLIEQYYDFGRYQKSANGQFLIDTTESAGNSLVGDFMKKNRSLKMNLTTNNLEVYLPFNIGFESWEKITDAAAWFFPNNTQKWVNYMSNGWAVFAQLILETDEIGYHKEVALPIFDYDTEAEINSSHVVVRSNGNPVTATIEGEILNCTVSHSLPDQLVDSVIGEITIRQGEGNKPYVLHTEILGVNPSSAAIPNIGQTKLLKEILVGGHLVNFRFRIDCTKLNQDLITYITSKIFVISHQGKAASLMTENDIAISAEAHNALGTENLG